MITPIQFQFNDKDLVVHQDVRGDLWFRGTNICEILGFSNPTTALKRHVPDMIQELSIGEGRPAYYVAENGLYILCFKSKNPKALEFQLWAADVIKTIRKTGQYNATADDQQHFEPFGMTLQRKIEECDKAIASASITTGEIVKIAASRKALEAIRKSHRKDQFLANVGRKSLLDKDTKLPSFIRGFLWRYNGEPQTVETMMMEARDFRPGLFLDALKDICYDSAQEKFVDRDLRIFLLVHCEFVVDGHCIVKDDNAWRVIKEDPERSRQIQERILDGVIK